MVIRRKDGNLYVLEGPNPVVKDQVSWDIKSLVFHNFSWDEITFSQVSAKFQKPKKTEKNPEQTTTTLKHHKEETAPASPTLKPNIHKEETAPAFATLKPIHQENTTPEPEPISENISSESKEFDLPYIKYKVLCYCLPAVTKIHTDKFYGESWQRTTYGKKFIFPCVIIQSSDINLEFWTSDPRKQIQEKSIIYPFSYEVHNAVTDSYDKVPYDEYRWWKVSEVQEKEGGWLFGCIPSEDHPDFSD